MRINKIFAALTVLFLIWTGFSPAGIDANTGSSLSEEYGFVIIANETFYEYDGEWNLHQLAEWHNQHDSLHAFVINLNEILRNSSFWVNGTWGDGNPDNPYRRKDEDAIKNYEMFNDSAAKIRNYLRYAHHELNVKYALLVGDTNSKGEGYFPVRKVYARGAGAPAGQTVYHEIIPTDMYYACLNGTFNADEDKNSAIPPYGGWGENATESSDNIDECDWEWEVAVGRFPVDSIEQLRNIVRKTIEYMSLDGSETYLYNITLAGHYGGWGGKANWCAEYSKTLNAISYSGWWDGVTTYGFNPKAYNITIVDANPDREEGIPYTDENVYSLFNAGCHIWYQAGHGWPAGWSNAGRNGDTFDIFDVMSLSNNLYSLIVSAIPCNVANFDSCDECFIEEWVVGEHGAFAAIGNTRYGWGPMRI